MSSYTSFYENIIHYEKDEDYNSLLCLKYIGSSPKITLVEKEYCKDLHIDFSYRKEYKKCCVLPKDHYGKCKFNYNNIFIKNDITKKLLSSIDLAIYNTPGNDCYVYKNRASRLFEIALSNNDEKIIRNKEIKKKCAIPLKDSSSPKLLAFAYLDWMTFIFNIKDINQYLNISYKNIQKIIEINKNNLIKFYHNRKIFDDDGNTICVILQKTLLLKNFSDIDRDNRVDIDKYDVQLGHSYPRSDFMVSIRNKNLLPMTRNGNLILSDNIFSDDIWINELKKIINNFP